MSAVALEARVARAAPLLAIALAALVGAGWWLAYQPPGYGGPPQGYPPQGYPPAQNPYGQPVQPPRQTHPPVRPKRTTGCDGSGCDGSDCADVAECIICDLDCLSGCGTTTSAVARATLAQRAPGILVLLAPLFILAAWRRRVARLDSLVINQEQQGQP